MGARFAVKGSKRANDALAVYFDNIKSWPQVSDQIFSYFQQKTQETFDNQGRGSTSWPDYWQQEPKYGMKKLGIFKEQDQGELFPRLLRWLPGRERLFPSLMNPSHPDAVRRITDDGVEYGTSVDYGQRHQEGIGTNEQGEPIPQRKFLIVTATDVAEVRRMISEHVGI